MSVTIKNWNLSSVSKDFKVGLKDYSSLYFDGLPLKDLLIHQSFVQDINSGRTPSRFNPEYWGDEYEFITMSDVDTYLYGLKERSVDCITEDAVISEKTLLQVPENSLIISNAMTIGLTFITDRPVFINQNVFWVNVDESKINKRFLLWYMNCIVRKKFQILFSAKYLSKQELSRIIIPNININIQNNFENIIKPIEKEIEELVREIRSPQEIINNVLSSYFGYEKDLIHKIRKGMTFGTQISNNSKLSVFRASLSDIKEDKIRFSARSLSPIFQNLESVLITNGYIKLKDILLNEITRGISPKYVSSGIPVVKTAHVTSNGLKTEFNEFVSNEFYNKKIKAHINEGDILISCTGKPSIGKIDLVENGITAIADGHIGIVHIDEAKYNKQFLVYFFRSIIGYFQFEREFVGSTNQIEIYPDVIAEFKIPDILLSEQQKIVDMINTEIGKQKEIEDQIDEKKSEIEKMINAILK